MLEKIQNTIKNKNNEKIKNKIRTIVGILGAMAFCYTLPNYHLKGRESVLYTNSIHSLVFVIMVSYLYTRVNNKLEVKKRRAYFALGLSLIFSILLVVGAKLESLDNFNITQIDNYIIALFCTLFFRPFIEQTWQYLDTGTKKRVMSKEDKRGYIFKNWFIILLSWLPVFLAFYPGAFVYDAWDEFEQVRTGDYTTHHPLLHVLLLGKIVTWGEEFFGSYNIGIAIYTIIQMLIIAAILSYTLDYIREQVTSKIWERGILLFYCFFPLFPMYAVCSAKDGLFTAFLLLSVVMLLRLYKEKEEFYKKKKYIFLFILSSTLMMLLRNNGGYAYITWMIVAILWEFFLKRKNNRKVILLFLLLIPFILAALINYTMEKGLNAQKGGYQEILTVPIQQMARVYKYAPEIYREDEKEILYEILPKEELHIYTPRISDLLKSKFDNQAFRQEPLKYLRLWMKIGIRKPFIYLNAWALTSYGYWYPDAVINVYGGTARHTIVYKDSSYFGFETEPPGTRESKLPLLEKVYRKISLELFQQKIPAVSLFFSPGLLFWCFLWCVTYYWYRKKWEVLIPSILILLVWSTVILGPTYLVRYVLILWFALPLLISLLKTGEKYESKD